MSEALKLEEIGEAMKMAKLDGESKSALLDAINAILEAKEAEKPEKQPQVKKQWVILVSDPAGKLDGVDLGGWVFQIPEEDSPATTQERIYEAAYAYNRSKRGRLLPVQTIGEAVENVKAGQFKEQELWVKTKTPVLVLRTDNEIPGVEGLAGVVKKGGEAA